MPDLSPAQYSLVYNAFSFVFAAMLAAFIYFILVRQQVTPELRNALTMSSLVVAVAGYHYFRIFESWQAAYTLTTDTLNNGAALYRHAVTNPAFNDAYRYIDWLLTVPLLVAELVAVLGLARAVSISLTARLAFAAVLMVLLGYPGEIASDNTARLIWGVLSTIPFLYIIYTLFTEFNSAVARQPESVRGLFSAARLLLFAVWGFYPIVYSLHYLSGFGSSANVIIAVQIGYCIADVVAKAGYGVLIYQIARAKSVDQQPVGAKGAVPAV